ncbi:MAG: hemerythrin domain-containing protein [Nitrososphaerota archaeon]|nr:hemerythrin domain-containing protein [Nitrososphaerota archaeon]
MSRSTDELRDDHRIIARVLEELGRETELMRQSGKVDAVFLKDIVDFSGTFIDRCHHGKEESCFFPCLERRGIGKESPILQVMLEEHQAGRDLVRRLGAQLVLNEGGSDNVGAITQLCEEYRGLLEVHIQKENGMLFPMGEETMEGGDDEENVNCFGSKKDDVGRGELDRLVKKAWGRSPA